MIFVTIGTSEPFDRLLRALPAPDDGEDLLVQAGRSDVRPPGSRCVEFLDFDELVEQMRRARVVVTHAGAGTVITALANGKRPVVVPRLARFGEAVDDHQLPFARRLADQNLVILVDDLSLLPEAIATAATAATGPTPAADPRLVRELRECIASRAGLPPAHGAAP